MLQSGFMTRDATKMPPRAAAPTFSPLYRQIKDFLIQSLEQGEWGPGDAIPSEAELAGRFNVSQGTVRKAIDEMAAENMLVRRQGKGTFVASHTDPRSFYRFLRLVPDDGADDHAVSEPLSCTAIPAPLAAARVLGIEVGELVVCVRRLLRFGGAPVVYDEIYLPREQFGGLTLQQLCAGERSLYTIFEQDYGVRMISAEERLRAVAADDLVAPMLAVRIGEPLLLVERTAYTYGSKPVEWRRGFYHTAKHHYRNDLG